MGTFKEISRADGSGTTLFYRASYANTFDIGDLDIDTESVLYRTGEEISHMTEDKPYIVLCTEDYIYTDQYGSLISVERGTVYEMEHGTVVDAISIGGGGGGGTPKSNLSTANSPLEQNVSVKAAVNLSIHFVTTALKKTGTIKLYVNNVLKSTKTVESGNDCEFDVSKYLKLGSNYFTIRTADDNGAEKNFDFLVNAVQLILSSGFNGSIPIPNTFDYIYRIKGAGEKTMHFVLDGVDNTVITTSSDVDLTQKFTNLSHGTHTLTVYASAELEGEEMFSNELNYSLLTFNPTSTETIMLSTFDTESSMEGEQLKIDYLVYNPNALVADVSMYINNELIMNTTADRTQHYWTVSNYPSGTVTFKIACGNVYIEKVVEVEPISVDIHEATEGLELKLTAANRSNQELEPARSTWSYNGIECQMNNFNWRSNGWIDGKLKLTGKANVIIPFKPFASDLRRTGKTIEVEFITYNAFSSESKLVSCIDGAGIGFDVTLDKSILASEQESVSTQFGEGTKIRISFVIEPSSSNRLVKTYINGVLSGLKQYAIDDNFQQADPTNIILNPDAEEIDITAVRIYNRALNSKEIVNNWIYDMSDISEKINAFNKNQIYDYYGNISYTKVKNFLPIIIVTGAMPTYKGDKKKVKVTYEHNIKTNYNFEQENCTIDVQGTSSQYYPRKNWKIKLANKVQVDDGWLEEKTYCMKADFMESSHMYNIGTATLINDLYDSEYYYPTRTVDNGVRDTMNGFPCVLFTKETEDADMYFAGTFMFNNDKADTDTLGYTTPQSESWEFKNNTSDHCLFKSDDFSPAASPLDNFEARYPDGYEDFSALSRVFSWVVSCKNNPTKFKQEFEQYFDLHYCLIYQVIMELAIMVDSRAKNMFLDTADGIIWYPRFYDMDTAWGLNNEGVPAWNYDVEIHDKIGSAYVWDDRGASEFWNLFEEAYASEIKTMYHTLRESKLTYDNILHYYIDNISNQFSASEYNEDSEFKYVRPLIDDGNATYLYAAQGNRQDYFRWIVKKRLYYLDSKYEYGDYNNDYATMRWYTLNGDLTITTYQTLYIKVRFGSTDVKVRVEHDTPTFIKAPEGLEFNDTEVIIWGASQIVDFGDLTTKYAGTVDISKCAKLQSLKLCDSGNTNTNLVSLSLGNNPLLRELKVINCKNLGGNLDLSGCTDLRIFDARGSKITGFILADGSVIEELYLPSTITSLTFKHLQNLKVLTAESFITIKTLIYENSSYPLNDILSKCGGLTRLRIIFDDDYSYVMDIDGFMYYYNNLLGVDEHGYNLPHPFMSGTIVLEIQDYHTETEINNYKNLIAGYYDHLVVRYNNIASKFSAYIYVHRYSGTSDVAPNIVSYDGKFFHRDPNTGSNPVKKMTGTVYNTPQETPPSGTEFLWLRISNSAQGAIYLPETIQNIPVYGFCLSGAPKVAALDVTSYIIPSSYRMFDLDFYLEYNLFDNNVYRYDIPILNLVHMASYRSGTYFIESSRNIGPQHPLDINDYNQEAAQRIKLNSIIFPRKVDIYPRFYGGYIYIIPDISEAKVIVRYGGSTPPSSDNWVPLLIDKQNMSYLPIQLPDSKVYVFGSTQWASSSWYSGYESNYYFKDHSLNGLIVARSHDVPLPARPGNGQSVFSQFSGTTLDLSTIEKADEIHPIFSSCQCDNLILGNKITNINSLGSCVIKNSFNADSIINLNYYRTTHFCITNTSLEHPQVFNNIVNWTSTYMYNLYNDPIQYYSMPNLETISPDHGTNGSYLYRCRILNIPDTRILKYVNGYEGSNDYVYLGKRIFNCDYNGFDCSELDWRVWTRGHLQLYHDFHDHFTFPGFFNLGQGFTTVPTDGGCVTIESFTNNGARYDDTEVIHTTLINILNNLYNLTLHDKTCPLRINGSYYDLLTPEEIAIATNKGWTVTRA